MIWHLSMKSNHTDHAPYVRHLLYICGTLHYCTCILYILSPGRTFHLGLDWMEPLHLYLKKHVLPRSVVSSDLSDAEPWLEKTSCGPPKHTKIQGSGPTHANRWSFYVSSRTLMYTIDILVIRHCQEGNMAMYLVMSTSAIILQRCP